ncbi:hypothetical protein LCGC14_3096900 [marine sediment metagenome]|uniref:Uncharacterized protein n=1 Tax=marine sediment metagenome TaxID=412755 RepID=A0A0F8WXP7_9ZZZZ
MNRNIPKWKVTLYWISPIDNAQRAATGDYSAWTPGGAVVQALQKYPPSGCGKPSAARKGVYLIEVGEIE